jgi:hypothetical protein
MIRRADDPRKALSLEQVRDFCVAWYEHLLAALSEDDKFRPICQSAIELVLAQYHASRRQGLLDFADECLGSVASMSKSEQRDFWKSLAPALRQTARMLDAAFRRHVTRVLSAGRIKTDADFYTIRRYVDDLEGDETQTCELRRAYALLDAYESKRPQ